MSGSALSADGLTRELLAPSRHTQHLPACIFPQSITRMAWVMVVDPDVHDFFVRPGGQCKDGRVISSDQTSHVDILANVAFVEFIFGHPVEQIHVLLVPRRGRRSSRHQGLQSRRPTDACRRCIGRPTFRRRKSVMIHAALDLRCPDQPNRHEMPTRYWCPAPAEPP